MTAQSFSPEALELMLLNETRSVFIAEPLSDVQAEQDTSDLLSQRAQAYGRYALLFAEAADGDNSDDTDSNDDTPSEVHQHLLTVQAIHQGQLPSERVRVEQLTTPPLNNVQLIMRAAGYIRELHAKNRITADQTVPNNEPSTQTATQVAEKTLHDVPDRELAVLACGSDKAAQDALSVLWARHGHVVGTAINAKVGNQVTSAEFTEEESTQLRVLVDSLASKRRKAVILRVMLTIPSEEARIIMKSASVSAVLAARSQAIAELITQLDQQSVAEVSTIKAAERKKLADRQQAIAASGNDEEAFDALWQEHGHKVAAAVIKKTDTGEPLLYTEDLSTRF